MARTGILKRGSHEITGYMHIKAIEKWSQVIGYINSNLDAKRRPGFVTKVGMSRKDY